MSVTDVHGPIDFVLIEFPGDKFKGAMAEALLDLIDRGIVQVYDILLIRKDADGTFSGIDISDLPGEEYGGLTTFAGARTGMLGDDDLREAAEAMEPGTVAALIVYENTWARPFVAAALDAGGQMIASERIPGSVVTEVLDALEATD